MVSSFENIALSSFIFLFSLLSQLLHPNCNFPSLLSSQYFPTILPLPQIHSSFFPFNKRQVSQGYQPNMAYQVIIRVGTFPCIKAG